MSFPVRAAVLMFLIGFVALWLVGASDLCPLAVDTDPALWPPGATVCEYERPNGARFKETAVPWGWWFAFAATGAAGGIALAITRRPG